MSAPAEPLKPTPGERAELDQLYSRIDDLNRRIDELRHERDAARRTVGQQQDDCSTHRARRIHHPRPVVRDVPTGEAL